MGTPKKLIQFNIKNAKFALKSSNGYETPVEFGYSDSIALEADYAEKVIFGDGRKVLTIPNDKGKTGSLGLLAISEVYEVAMKRQMKTASGTAQIKQIASIEHAIYFETEFLDESGKTQTAKTVIYGVTSGRASESFNQTTDDINNNNISYPLTIKGTPLLAATGTEAYKDAEGNEVYVWQETSIPGDAGYDAFGKNISDPKAPAGV